MWTYVLTELDGRPVGELRQAPARTWRRSLNRGRTASITIGRDHPLTPTITSGLPLRLKAYDRRTGAPVLRHHGRVIGRERSGDTDGPTTVLNSAGPQWDLLSRLVGRSSAGASIGTALDLVDRGEAMGRLVDALNAGSVDLATLAGDTGIRRGDIVASWPGYFGPWRYLPAASAFTELATGIDAPDWDLRPLEPAADSVGVKVAALDVAPFFGAVSGVVFEYGAGKRNVDTWREVVDEGTEANDLVHLPDGFPDSATAAPLERNDPAAIAQRGLREDVVAASGLVVDELRERLLLEHLRIRATPRRIITFTVVADLDPAGTPLEERTVPRPFVDYDVGDIVRFRAVEAVNVLDQDGTVIGYLDSTTVDALFRVYTIDVAIDDKGVEQVSLTFVEEGA